MTTEPTPVEKALAAQGATLDNIDESTTGAGAAPPPAPPNEPPPAAAKKEAAGELPDIAPVADPAKEAADKEAAEAARVAKEASDKEAAGPLKDYTNFADSPAAQAAVNLLKEAGVGPNAANEYFAKALKTGDLKDIDVKGLEEKLGKDKATLVLAGVHAHYDGLKAQTDATTKTVYEIFGGQDNWNTVRTWAQGVEKTDAGFKAKVDSIRSMIDEGGARAEAGTRELLRMYNAAPNQKGLGTVKLAVGTGTGNVVGTHLTRGDYITELKAAHARGAKPAEIQALDARRMAGKRTGI